MPKSPGRKSNPASGAYRPHVAARRPGRRPAAKPAFRVLVHCKYLAVRNELADRGLANAQQLWDHVAMTPGQPPKVGTSSVMKGKHNAPNRPGYSRMSSMSHFAITCSAGASIARSRSAGGPNPSPRRSCRVLLRQSAERVLDPYASNYLAVGQVLG